MPIIQSIKKNQYVLKLINLPTGVCSGWIMVVVMVVMENNGGELVMTTCAVMENNGGDDKQ